MKGPFGMPGAAKTGRPGFALIELLVVLAILGVLLAFVVPRYVGLTGESARKADASTVEILNRVTDVYAADRKVPRTAVFSPGSTDGEKLRELVEEGYLPEVPVPQGEDAVFAWDPEKARWTLGSGPGPDPGTANGNGEEEENGSPGAPGDPDLAVLVAALETGDARLEGFLGTGTTFAAGTTTLFDPTSWNGYLEKLLQAGDIAGNERQPEHRTANTIGYSNPYSAQTTVINDSNWNQVRNARSGDLPPAIFLTSQVLFDPDRDNHNYIENNLDTLAGTVVFFKRDGAPNDQMQIYRIREDGSLSAPQSATEILPSL